MKLETITKTITQPLEVIEAFANDLGYQEFINNPAYEASVDAETGEETNNGEEPTIPNKQSRKDYVSEKFDDFVAEKFFGQFASRNAERTKLAEAKEVTKQTIVGIKSSITTS